MAAHILVPVSALEHFSYCPRQCGLIHLESVWDENVFTIRGTQNHERADQPISRKERGRRVERALPIWSDEHGLTGRCDVVEFDDQGVPCPVETKSGGRQAVGHAALQLCAQAICLSEMLGITAEHGFIYLVKTKERVEVSFTADLVAQTLAAVHQIREMMEDGALPPPLNNKRCPKCSLVDACMPGPVCRASQKLPSLFVPWDERDLP